MARMYWTEQIEFTGGSPEKLKLLGELYRPTHQLRLYESRDGDEKLVTGDSLVREVGDDSIRVRSVRSVEERCDVCESVRKNYAEHEAFYADRLQKLEVSRIVLLLTIAAVATVALAGWLFVGAVLCPKN